MFRPLSLYIGSRFSRAKQRNKMVSFISISSTLGIAIGVAVIIIGLSAMNGFERELQNRVLSVIPHGELQAVNPPFTDWQPVIEKAEQHPRVTGAAPYILFTALLEKGTNLKAVEVRGVDPTQEEKVSAIPQFIQNGAWQQFKAGSKQVILGQGVADKLGIKVGDWITAMIPNPDPALKLRAPHRVRLQVSGLLALGGQIDHNLALVPLADAQSYLAMGDGVTGVSLQVDNVLEAMPIVREVGYTLPVYVYLKSWTQKYGYLYRDIQMVRTIMYLVMVLVIGVACFNIVSTLMMSVKDRSPDIAILRTMGASDGLIKSIFIWHGVLSGVLGSLVGSAIGCFVALNLTSFIKGVEQLIGHQFLSGDIYFVDFLPTELAMQDVALVTITAVILSLLATWYPARRASALHPAQVLSAK
ncbi:lipoprotein-releasing ABC transporter permease subunit LolE [Photobacterium sanguinicancri]|uniref:Lipoprotein-releasing ABC transporter permease subunit LolE n=1 Tax=Photobacterium sanguinicancri TaxID=875932 RepID=A0AAW7XZC2_9GAMM|nr:lipoprotein-releasing ABC transporter permease subunit LolE [Photobacterium sanguinicancri]KXI23818.1 outer membrane-specific lipoprotein transporter subunit LolE [Photobacterium sanguinicancri]MDO6541200.1 lipoprotein-releasing ABC transporter permease subunit LolE [Photobacterium sanguinicancri]